MNSDHNFQIIYSSILIALLVSGLITSNRYSNQPLIKYAIGWIGIFFMLILAYSFKDRIASEIIPYKVAERGEYLVVEQSSDGHYYMDLLVNDQNIKFLVDTGASSITLNQSDAQKLGIDLNKLNFDSEYETANGVVFGANYTVESIKIGSIVFNNIPVNINGGELKISLLGMSFFENFDYYKFDNGKLFLKY